MRDDFDNLYQYVKYESIIAFLAAIQGRGSLGLSAGGPTRLTLYSPKLLTEICWSLLKVLTTEGSHYDLSTSSA